MKRGLLSCSIALIVVVAFGGASATDLYGPKGVTPQAVGQGRLGSCYFHSSVGALAATNPDLLRKAIRENANGTYTVTFADEKTEDVYPEDVKFARDSGYDISDGLWVAVLFRAYAQRTLRQAVIDAVKQSALPFDVKIKAAALVAGTDSMLLAWDRTIRQHIDQNGDIDRIKFRNYLMTQLQPVPVSDDFKKQFLDKLDSSGVLDSIVSTVKENGELFGAYRAVGQGGIPGRVLKALAGDSRTYLVKDPDDLMVILDDAKRRNAAVVVATGKPKVDEVQASWQSTRGEDPKGWYVETHAYTLVRYNQENRVFDIRNPWGRHPDPNGEFFLPLDGFMSAYADLAVSGAPPAPLRRATSNKAK